MISSLSDSDWSRSNDLWEAIMLARNPPIFRARKHNISIVDRLDSPASSIAIMTGFSADAVRKISNAAISSPLILLLRDDIDGPKGSDLDPEPRQSHTVTMQPIPSASSRT